MCFYHSTAKLLFSEDALANKLLFSEDALMNKLCVSIGILQLKLLSSTPTLFLVSSDGASPPEHPDEVTPQIRRPVRITISLFTIVSLFTTP